LPINILNEKIYIFVWFWFLGVLLSSLFGLSYRLLSIFDPIRKLSINTRLRSKSQRESAESIISDTNYGDWFLIYKLGQNMDCATFGELIIDMDQAFRKWDTVKLPDEEMILEISAPRPSIQEDNSPYHHGGFNA
jgi:hypothetical protein